MKTQVQIELAHVSCYQCGTVFGIESNFNETLKYNGNSFFCPSGHEQYYNKRENLEKKIEALECRVPLCRENSIWDFVTWRSVLHSRFKDFHISTIGDALQLGEKGLLGIYGVGKKTIDEINYNLGEYDLRLKL